LSGSLAQFNSSAICCVEGEKMSDDDDYIEKLRPLAE